MRSALVGLAAAAALLAILLGSRPAVGDERRLLEASGVATECVPRYLAQVDALAAEFQAKSAEASSNELDRVRALHAFLHRRVLLGKYQASASDVGVALDGGAFNCVSATLLWRMLAERCGIDATAMSTRGHVWCRVNVRQANETREGISQTAIEIEATCRDWFAIVARYRGVPNERVSPAMQEHRRRVAAGRVLDERRMLAVLHFNRGVSQIRGNHLPAAAWANLQALAFDSDCEPARENLAAVAKELAFSNRHSISLESRLILWAIRAAVDREPSRSSPLAVR
jgi:hypothetical protein